MVDYDESLAMDENDYRLQEAMDRTLAAPFFQRFGNAVPERSIFASCLRIAKESGKTLYGYFDDDGTYVLTETPQDDFHAIWRPTTTDVQGDSK